MVLFTFCNTKHHVG